MSFFLVVIDNQTVTDRHLSLFSTGKNQGGGCHCNCHSGTGGGDRHSGPHQKVLIRNKMNAGRDEASQTLSTGDIVITKIYFKENQDQEKVEEKTLVPTQKK